MSLLSQVTRGKQKAPMLICVYGPEGVGKSYFASKAPSPIFIGPELGTLNLDVARFPTPKAWADILSAIDELMTADHNYKTLVVDSVDWLEPLVFAHICKKYNAPSINAAAGGFGRGVMEAQNEMSIMLKKLTSLRMEKHMNIILLGHSRVNSFQDPTSEAPYSRYELKLQDGPSVSIRSLVKEYVDCLLFCNWETFSKGSGKEARGISTRERKMWTERDGGFDAKNRFGLPFEMPLDWDTFQAAMDSANFEDPAKVKERIAVLAGRVDEELKAKVMEQVEKWSDNSEQLLKIEQRLLTKLGE